MSKVWGGLEVFGLADGEPLHTAKALWLIIRLTSKPLYLRAFQSQQVNNFSTQIAQQHTSNTKSSMTNFKSRNTLFACMRMQALLATLARFHASLHLEMHLRGMFVHTVWFIFYMKPWLFKPQNSQRSSEQLLYTPSPPKNICNIKMKISCQYFSQGGL